MRRRTAVLRAVLAAFGRVALKAAAAVAGAFRPVGGQN
jgi:hypothetical protein